MSPKGKFIKSMKEHRTSVSQFMEDNFGIAPLVEVPTWVMRIGIHSIDWALGGGLPSGLVEVYGDPSTGKSCFVAHAVGWAQDNDRVAAILPTEKPHYAYLQRIGVDLDNFIEVKSTELALKFLEQNENALLVIDPISAISPSPYMTWVEKADAFCAELLEALKANSCVIMTSQVRAKRSADPQKRYSGGTESASRRLTDRFAVRIALTRKEVSEVSYTLGVDIISNTLAPPARYVEVQANKGAGIEYYRDLVDMAVELSVLKMHGYYYWLDEIRLAQGKLNMTEVLRDKEVHDEIVKRIELAAYGR